MGASNLFGGKEKGGFLPPSPFYVMDEHDWEAAKGVICSSCGEETLRILDSTCPRCHLEKEKEKDNSQAMKRLKRYYTTALASGRITLAQMRKGLLGN